jgi:hypothetical protein
MAITPALAARIFAQYHLGDPGYADIVISLLDAHDEEEALCRLECWDIDRDTAHLIAQRLHKAEGDLL